MRFSQSCIFLAAVALLSLSGCSGFAFFSNGRALIVVTVNPAIADPINFPNSQVQFTASGTFNSAPTFTNSLPNLRWSVAPDQGRASITQSGIARCAPGFVGTVQVIATAPADPSLPLSAANQVVGTAQMMCP